jgi:hypothetical protein
MNCTISHTAGRYRASCHFSVKTYVCLADPNIRRLLEMTKKEKKTHFAILTKDAMTARDLTIAANHFSRIGIEVIWVNDFSDITKTLQLLI